MNSSIDNDPQTTSAHDTNDAEVTLSEERLEVSTEWFVSRRVRLRKRIVTETRLVKVLVRREELVVETDDVTTAGESAAGVMTDWDAALGAAREDRPFVMVLREEVPVVTTAVRAYEQVTATTSVVTTPTSLDESVRHEEYAVQRSPADDAGATSVVRA